ncbi:MAG: class I SAM-dependent methyltransferase [Planctomycetota bacterium]
MSQPLPADFWNQRYAEDEPAYGDEPNAFLAEQIDQLSQPSARDKPGRVLCLAEGQGRNALFLARLGWEVTAVDFSAVGMRAAARVAEREDLPLQTVVADLAEYDLGVGQWDLVVSIFGHVPPEARKKTHARIEPALRPGGRFVLEAYTPSQTARDTGGPGPGAEALCMTAAGLREELVGLSLEHLEETQRIIHEGRYHTGLADVVQVVAVRPDK